jgi:hypothetical protein
MTASTVEVLALAIAEMNSAFTPRSEAFMYRNPGKLWSGGKLRQFTTWAGGLKSLLSELIRYGEENSAVSVAANYGCDSIEKEFILFDYLTQAFGRDIGRNTTLAQLDGAGEDN